MMDAFTNIPLGNYLLADCSEPFFASSAFLFCKAFPADRKNQFWYLCLPLACNLLCWQHCAAERYSVAVASDLYNCSIFSGLFALYRCNFDCLLLHCGKVWGYDSSQCTKARFKTATISYMKLLLTGEFFFCDCIISFSLQILTTQFVI